MPQIDVDESLLADFRANLPWIAYFRSDSEIVAWLLREKLRDEAADGYTVDPVSQCLSTQKFKRDVREAVARRSQNPAGPFFKTAVCIDIENLKRHNDVYGLPQGDLTIRSIGESLKNQFSTDHVYRLGGDEFVILSYEQIEEISLNWSSTPRLKTAIIAIETKDFNSAKLSLEECLVKSIEMGVQRAKLEPTRLTLDSVEKRM